MDDRLRQVRSLGAALGVTCLLAGVGLSTTEPTYSRVYKPTPTRAPTPTRITLRPIVPTLPPGQARYPSVEAAQAAVPFRIARPTAWREGRPLGVYVTRSPDGAVSLVEQRFAVPGPDGLDVPLGVSLFQSPAGSAVSPSRKVPGDAEPVELRPRAGRPVGASAFALNGERRVSWLLDGHSFAVAAPDLLDTGWFVNVARDVLASGETVAAPSPRADLGRDVLSPR